MKYNLANIDEAQAAFNYLTDLIGLEAIAELKKVDPKRSLNQNNYLHLLLTAFGINFGYTLEEAKLIYKQLNSGIYEYTKKKRIFWKSSAELTTEEMTKSIEILRQWSDKAGFTLPEATDQGWLREIENEAERERFYL